MSPRARIRKALLAALSGWVAGLILALPFQLIEAMRNIGVTRHLQISNLAYVLALWLLLTFGMALYWCGLFFLPFVWLASAGWVLGHRSLWIIAFLVFGVLLMAARLHVWTALDHDGVSLINFWMWAVFAGTFFAATSALYTRALRKSV